MTRSLTRKSSLGGNTIGDHSMAANALMAIISNIRMGESDGGGLEGGSGGGGPSHRPKSAAARRAAVKTPSMRSKRASDSMGGAIPISVNHSGHFGGGMPLTVNHSGHFGGGMPISVNHSGHFGGGNASHSGHLGGSFTSHASSLRMSHASHEHHGGGHGGGGPSVMFAEDLLPGVLPDAKPSSQGKQEGHVNE